MLCRHFFLYDKSVLYLNFTGYCRQERFRSLVSSYTRYSSVAVIVYNGGSKCCIFYKCQISNHSTFAITFVPRCGYFIVDRFWDY